MYNHLLMSSTQYKLVYFGPFFGGLVTKVQK